MRKKANSNWLHGLVVLHRKIRKAKYDLDEEMLKPYFPLENVKKGIFLLTEKLYGLKYEKLSDVPIYHPVPEAYEVKGADNQHIGICSWTFISRKQKGRCLDDQIYRDQYITRDGEYYTHCYAGLHLPPFGRHTGSPFA